MADTRASTISAAAGSSTATDPPRRLAKLEVSLGAIVENWRYFANLGAAEAGAVIKADAYGMDARQVARALAAAGCRTFFVASRGEGLEARRVLGEGPRILVLNGPGLGEAASFREAKLEPVINALDQMQAWRDGAFTLHVDTGMNRLGLPLGDLGAIDRAPAAIMSHLACGADPAHPLNEAQRARFLDAAQSFPHAQRSLSASAGALLGPAYAFDLLRPGIGLYGGGPLSENNPNLAVAARLEAPILQIRAVFKGDTIGYGATYTATKAIKTATCALGYADGFLRSASGKGYGWLKGKACPILGRVSMDLVTLDVSAVKDARVGDAVEFLGADARLDAVAAAAGTIPYEILTNLGGRVRRVIAP
ncbi:MAG TPA: alanine racemase [Caulobacterales bacterium]|nr:alanine racemase [Caulobacterales bacterium]